MSNRILAGILAVISLLTAPLSLAQQARPDPTTIERGRYLVEIAASCGVCHATRSPDRRIIPGMGLAGGYVITGRGFRAVAPNITPDPETGIGRWTDGQIALAIREGLRPDGSIIGLPMPMEVYRGTDWQSVLHSSRPGYMSICRSPNPPE